MKLCLVPRRTFGIGTPPLIVLNALLKSVKTGSDANPERPAIFRTFRVADKVAHRLRLPAGVPFSLEVLFVGASDHDIDRWLKAFAAHLSRPAAGFDMVTPPETVDRTGESFVQATDAEIEHTELELLSPLPFERKKGARRTDITIETLFRQIRRRVQSLFGDAPLLPSLTNLHLQSNYWEYVELRHASKSQPGNQQFYNGCVGSLYLSGKLGGVMPWLRCAEALHAGGGIALNPFGYARLHSPSRPRFDTELQKPVLWETQIERLSSESDDWCERMAADYGAPIDTSMIVRGMLNNISRPDWHPSPTMAFTVPKRNGRRRLEKLPASDLLLHAVLHEMLQEPFDRLLEPASMGYRRGKTVQQAIEAVKSLIKDGYRYVVESDIEDFFPSIDHNRLEILLRLALPPADDCIRELIGKLLRTPCIEGGRIYDRNIGLAQGSPLSPLFANIYLDRFDEIIDEAGGKMVRYADDFVILTRKREDAEKLLGLAREELASAGLSLGEEKTAILEVSEGFRFLGQPFGAANSDVIAELLVTPARKAVYVVEQDTFIGHNGDALEIRRGGRILDTIPLRRVSDIVVMENAGFSSGLVKKCAQHGIPLVFTLGTGYHVATLSPDSRRYHAVAERQAIHYASLTPTERLVFAKSFAAQKIANYKPLIASRYRAGDDETLRLLEGAIASIEAASDISTVRGHEGRAARLVFGKFKEYISVPEFSFSKRLRDKPDRMNSLFNFGYYLLFSRINTLVRAAGINPYLGYLHDGADDYETLVCDIEELFRAPVDRMLIATVNLKIIRPDDFRESNKGLRLQPTAIKRLIGQFERMLHSDAGGISLLRAIEAQIEAFRRHYLDGRSLWYFRYGADKHKENTHDASSQIQAVDEEDGDDADVWVNEEILVSGNA